MTPALNILFKLTYDFIKLLSESLFSHSFTWRIWMTMEVYVPQTTNASQKQIASSSWNPPKYWLDLHTEVAWKDLPYIFEIHKADINYSPERFVTGYSIVFGTIVLYAYTILSLVLYSIIFKCLYQVWYMEKHWKLPVIEEKNVVLNGKQCWEKTM